MFDTISTRPATSLIGREPVLSLARELLSSSADIDIVGAGGSGRSSVVEALALAAADEQATIVRISGVRSLRGNPLAAIHAAGIGSQIAPDRRPVSPLQNAIDALGSAVADGRSIVMVDDADLLDEASLGVIEAVCSTTRIPLVRTRSRIDHDGVRPAGYVIELGPLRYDELEAVLTERLGADVDAGTMSRIYAKSGGNVGLAITMANLASREGRLVLKGNAWTAIRSLWSPALRGAVAAYLSGLDDQHREALEMLALVGVSDLETALKLSDSDILEGLEDAGVLHIVPNGGRQMVTVDPPLLSEYYRHEASTVRRQRLSGQVREALGSRESLEAILADTPVVPAGLGDSDALFVRMVHEQARTRRIVAEAEWRRTPHAGSTYTYLRTLLNDAGSDETLAQVFHEAEDCQGEPLDVARLATLRAHWRLVTGAPLDEVLEELTARVTDLGPYARLADAAAVLFETVFRGIPEDADTRLHAGSDLPPIVRTQLLEAAVIVNTLRGRFATAHARFEEVASLDPAGVTTSVTAIHGLTLLGEGKYAEALAWAKRGIDEAHAQLDVPGLRAHSYVAALCLTTAGDYAEAEQVISTALALGEPTLIDLTDYMGLQTLSSIISVRRDNAELGEKIRDDIAANPASSIMIGRVGLAWSSAQLIAYRGQTSEAAALLFEHSDELHAQHIDAWAAHAMLSALEIAADDAGLEKAAELLSGMESGLHETHLAFLVARQQRDAEAIVELVPRLASTGRPGLAVVAYRLAAEWQHEAGEHERARKTEQERDAFMATLPAGSYDATRFFATAINLTDREREISRLVASGLSNPQIASRLVLSVRTVESHLHRIMRKTAVSNRSELASLIRSIAA